MMSTSAHGMAGPTSESAARSSACTGNATSSARMPKRASSQPAMRLDASVMAP